MICFTCDGGKQTITQTGKHSAVRIGNMVVDNLHPNGASWDYWLSDFDAIGGIGVTVLEAF